jgi:ribosomal protein S18 acetylase RimI-like enzyme
MNQVIIKTLTKDLLDEYRAFRFQAITCEPPAFGTTFEEEENLSDAEILQNHFLENGFDINLYAEVDGVMIGMIRICKRKRWFSRAHARFRFFFVQPDFRGNKIGCMILESAIAHVKQFKSIKKIDLGVVETQKKAISMYESFGFKATWRGKTKRYYNGLRYNTRIMTLYL